MHVLNVFDDKMKIFFTIFASRCGQHKIIQK